ncbi:hypothetical protein BT96DRAFT_941630 [Gymnopus androsaceus JB14]|uniref:Uncharacterized protein n=1 Tax=Gymnopus androsaceus JB14 TaxID=1447944 RepID=A0A6A4HDS0_9AGAR|nr:hypothetical protein BT96DRAFT_941630 [Gymnopus androsaceus JB14]
MYTASVGCGTASEGYGEAMPAVSDAAAAIPKRMMLVPDAVTNTQNHPKMPSPELIKRDSYMNGNNLTASRSDIGWSKASLAVFCLLPVDWHSGLTRQARVILWDLEMNVKGKANHIQKRSPQALNKHFF